MFERVFDHVLVEGAKSPELDFQLRWFGHGPDGDTSHPQKDIPREHLRRYCRMKKLPLVGLQPFSRLFPSEAADEE